MGAPPPESQPAPWQDLDDSLLWIRATQLQIERFVGSFGSFATEAPPEQRDATTTVADGHFLLIAAAQAEKALKRADRAMDADLSIVLRSLRNIHEHWEQHRHLFVSKRFPKRRAGAEFADRFPDAIPWNYKYDGTGTYISALRLEDLWTELLEAEAVVEAELRRAQADAGHAVPALTADRERPFPTWKSKALAIAMITQTVMVHFDDEADVEAPPPDRACG